jgi:3-oxoacyl-[acyl-carrier-protein] synthase-3
VTDRTEYAVGIRSVGRYVPETELTNADLVKRYDTSDSWLREKLGIHTRRVANADQWTSDLAVQALFDACERSGTELSEIDLLICCTGTPDHLMPATAAAVLRKAELFSTPGFDVNPGGCAGGVFALDTGAKYIMSGEYRKVAVVIADTVAQALDPADRTTNAIFGDGAGCYLLERCAPGTGVGPTLLRTRADLYYTAHTARQLPPDGLPNRFSGSNIMQMDAKGVLNFALDSLPGFAKEVVEAAGTTLDEVDLILTHQANPGLVRRLIETLGQPREKTVIVADRLGNTSGSSLVLSLAEALDTGRLRPGNRVLLLAFGAGMSYGGTVLTWCAPEDFAGFGEPAGQDWAARR